MAPGYRSLVAYLLYNYVFSHLRWRHIALPLTAHSSSHQFCVCVYHAGGQTRNVDPMLGYC